MISRKQSRRKLEAELARLGSGLPRVHTVGQELGVVQLGGKSYPYTLRCGAVVRCSRPEGMYRSSLRALAGLRSTLLLLGLLTAEALNQARAELTKSVPRAPCSSSGIGGRQGKVGHEDFIFEYDGGGIVIKFNLARCSTGPREDRGKVSLCCKPRCFVRGQ